MFSYQLMSGSTNILRSDGAQISADHGNTDYGAYLAWIDEGNTAAPAQTDPTAAWAAHQGAARVALDSSDVTMLRCLENAVAVPAEWIAYRKALRSILSSSGGDATQPLPTRPAYPAGT